MNKVKEEKKIRKQNLEEHYQSGNINHYIPIIKGLKTSLSEMALQKLPGQFSKRLKKHAYDLFLLLYTLKEIENNIYDF